MSLDDVIRKIHIYTGLQVALALLFFSSAVITLSLDKPITPQVSHHQFVGDIKQNDLKLAIAIHNQVGLRFEHLPQNWMISEDESGRLQIKYNSPNAKRLISYNKLTKDIEITHRPKTFSQFVNHMHQESFGRRVLTDSLWLWAWSLYIEFSVIALFTLPITGLYIWLSGRQKKKYWAHLSLVSSSITMIFLWNLIR